jgi:hypothetical protein
MPWPDPQRPGEPAESSRPWHWVTRGEDGGLHPLPLGWNPHLRHWVASAAPPPPLKMVYKKDAVRNHVLIFLGTLFGTLFLLDQFGRLH